jgi:hypothetical protein
MCQTNGKLLAGYQGSKRVERLLEALGSSTGIPIDDIALIRTAGPIHKWGTWVPQVAVNLAGWCSAELGAAVIGCVDVREKGFLKVQATSIGIPIDTLICRQNWFPQRRTRCLRRSP